jgi:hypothetical protein
MGVVVVVLLLLCQWGGALGQQKGLMMDQHQWAECLAWMWLLLLLHLELLVVLMMALHLWAALHSQLPLLELHQGLSLQQQQLLVVVMMMMMALQLHAVILAWLMLLLVRLASVLHACCGPAVWVVVANIV